MLAPRPPPPPGPRLFPRGNPQPLACALGLRALAGRCLRTRVRGSQGLPLAPLSRAAPALGSSDPPARSWCCGSARWGVLSSGPGPAAVGRVGGRPRPRDPRTGRRKPCGGFRAAAGNRGFTEGSRSPERAFRRTLPAAQWKSNVARPSLRSGPGRGSSVCASRGHPESSPPIGVAEHPNSWVSETGSGETEEGVHPPPVAPSCGPCRVSLVSRSETWGREGLQPAP